MEDREVTNATPKRTRDGRSQRVLACVLCQQRKVKCDRQFPCINCRRSGQQCVQATLVPRRPRRRLREREITERLSHYESLLKKHKIEFEPMQDDGHGSRPGSPDEDDEDQTHASPATRSGDKDNGEHGSDGKPILEPRDFWHAMTRSVVKPGDAEDVDGAFSNCVETREKTVANAWSQLYKSNSQLVFRSRLNTTDLTDLHPQQIHIFRLWQIYVDNVSPLLRVTHNPTLQSRIINAAGNLQDIDPKLEALMFSIYCIAILSISDRDCQSFFQRPKKELMHEYHVACEQALMNAEFLRSDDREILTALFFYLFSAKQDTDPRSMVSLLGIAIRIAQRLGIQQEGVNAKRSIFEAEMRRRLWWALVIFDARACEMGDNRSTSLLPTWDCKLPLNVADCDLRPEMTALPPVHDQPSEALFIVLRAVLHEFSRHSSWSLDLVNPRLKHLSKFTGDSLTDATRLSTFCSSVESQYLKLCHPSNPLQFLTIHWTRGHLARLQLMHHWTFFAHQSTDNPDVQPAEDLYDSAAQACITMIEADTALNVTPFVAPFAWLSHFYFPFVAYIHLAQEIRRRPSGPHIAAAWRVLSENYGARFEDEERWKASPFAGKPCWTGQGDVGVFETPEENPFYMILTSGLLQAWKDCESEHKAKNGKDLPIPSIIIDVRRRRANFKLSSDNVAQSQSTQLPLGPQTGQAIPPTPESYSSPSIAQPFQSDVPSYSNTAFPADGGMMSFADPGFGSMYPWPGIPLMPGQGADGGMDWTMFDFGNMGMQS